MGGIKRREVNELFRRQTIARFHELQLKLDQSREGYALLSESIEPQSQFRWQFHKIIAVRMRLLHGWCHPSIKDFAQAFWSG